MAPARVGTVPIPSPDLAKMRQMLAPNYGAQIWEDDESGQRILVIRVPHDEPDMVNDIEAGVEYLSVSDTRELSQVLLMGGRRIHAVPARLIEERMVGRVESDREQAGKLRQILSDDEPVRLYRDPRDTHKVLRLGVRVPRATVQEVEDGDLEKVADRIGDQIENGKLRGVRAVYLVADQDDVRLEPEMFFSEIREQWTKRERRREARAQTEARVRLRETERRRMLRDLEKRFPPEPRVTYAPVRRTEERISRARSAAEPPKSFVEPSPEAPTARQTARARAATPVQDAGPTPARAETVHSARSAEPAPSPAAANVPGWNRLMSRLEGGGYQVLPYPDVPGHHIDMAAERRDGYPERLVVVFPPRLTVAAADRLLATSRALGVDLALAVCEGADPEARNRLVATKVKWVAPHDLDHLSL